MKLENPFIVTGRYVAEEYFCDRRTETSQLAANIINWRNTVLVSSRRMGKSGLIEHTFAQESIKTCFETFYIDIFATNSFEEFVFLLSKEITSRLQTKGRKFIDRFFTIVNSLQASFGMDAITGAPNFSLSIGNINDSGKTLEQVFSFLESSQMPCVVAIDEFQQIADYQDGKKVIASLRTLVQKCKQTRFIFAGSNRRMMGKIFNSPSEPFYQSCIPLYLDAIAIQEYCGFAQAHFSSAGKSIPEDCFAGIYGQFEGHTWYVQTILNRLFEVCKKGTCVSSDDVRDAVTYILDLNTMYFQEMLRPLSARQKELLIAIAKEGKVEGITSAAFVKKHSLASASAVQGAAKPLMESETIVREDDIYRISNRFFSLWLARRY